MKIFNSITMSIFFIKLACLFEFSVILVCGLNPEFDLLTSKEENDDHFQMGVRYDDGNAEIFTFEPISGKRFECQFYGEVDKSDPNGSNAVIKGCDNELELIISSSHLAGRIRTFLIQMNEKAPHKVASINVEDITDVESVRQRPDCKWVRNPSLDVDVDQDPRCKMSSEYVITLRIMYDATMLRVIDENIDEWLTKVIQQTEFLFKHASQTPKYNLHILSIERFNGIITFDLHNLTSTTMQDIHANAWIFFWYDEYETKKIRGKAFESATCLDNDKGYHLSVVKFFDNIESTAQVVAHELEHNLGEKHDVDQKKGLACIGIKHYVTSTFYINDCSRRDRLLHYQRVINEKGKFCLAPGATAVPNCPNPGWMGNQRCDDELNNPECLWDKGDCCEPHSLPSEWNAFCKECACLAPSKNALKCNKYQGDGFCDDHLNNEECEYDGGDCCGKDYDNWNIYCTKCKCLKPT